MNVGKIKYISIFLVCSVLVFFRASAQDETRIIKGHIEKNHNQQANLQPVRNIKLSASQLVEILKYSDSKTQIDKTAKQLIKLKDKSTVSPLINILKSSNSYKARIIMRVLGKIADTSGLMKVFVKDYDTQRYEFNSIVRQKAINILADRRAYDALGVLYEQLEDKYTGVRRAAALAIGKIQGPDTLLKLLDDDNKKSMAAVVFALGELKIQGSIPVLLKMARKYNNKPENEIVVKQIARALFKIKKDREFWAQIIYHYADELRRQAAIVLGRLEAKESSIYVLVDRMSSDRCFKVRASAAEALGLLKARQRGLDVLIKGMSDPNERVRTECAKALGLIGDKKAADVLLKALDDNNKYVRLEAVVALGRLKAKQADVKLIHLLFGDNSSLVREHAARALGQIRSRFSMLALLKAVDSENKDIQKAAENALFNIADKKLLLSMLNHKKANIRAKAAELLGKSKYCRRHEVLSLLVKAVSYDKNNNVSKAAAEALKKIERFPPKILAELSEGVHCRPYKRALVRTIFEKTDFKKLLASKDANIRKYGVYALGRMRDEESLDLLIQSLCESDPAVLKEVHTSIDLYDEGCVAEALLKYTINAKDQLKSVAQRKLLSLGDDSVEFLIQSLGDEDKAVRLKARALLLEKGECVIPLMMEEINDALTTVPIKNGIISMFKDFRPDSVNALISGLRHEDPDMVKSAAWALGEAKIGHMHAIRALIITLLRNKKYPDVQKTIVEALAGYQNPQADGFLLNILDKMSEPVQTHIVDIFSKSGNSKIILRLGSILERKKLPESVQKQIIDLLDNMDTPKARLILIRVFADKTRTRYIRGIISNIIVKKGGSIIPIFLETVKHVEDEAVLKSVIKVIDDIKDTRALAYLVEKIQDKRVQGLVIKSLRSMPVKDVVPVLVNGIDIRKPDVSNVVTGLLAERGKIGIEAIINKAKMRVNIKKEYYIKAGCIRALGVLKQSQAVPLLIETLKHKDIQLVILAAKSLGRIKDKRAFFPLTEALSHDSEKVREVILKVIEGFEVVGESEQGR